MLKTGGAREEKHPMVTDFGYTGGGCRPLPGLKLVLPIL